MKRIAYALLGLLALGLVPVAMYVVMLHFAPFANPAVAIWGPISVLVADAVLFFFALGYWPITAFDRLGIAVVLPLLLAMISWWALMDAVAARLN